MAPVETVEDGVDGDQIRVREEGVRREEEREGTSPSLLVCVGLCLVGDGLDDLGVCERSDVAEGPVV